ncbi:MAG: MopE-related protein [Myxococcota bacterium]|jgi:uncharacterized repeat protein (TIGR01451 family)|nr:MopE-related protein [Myxococcota bacterium]
MNRSFRTILSSVSLSFVLLFVSSAHADEPLLQRQTWRGNINYFMTGAALATDGEDPGGEADTLLPSVSFEVSSADVPPTAQLERARLYWGGTQNQPSAGACARTSLVPDKEIQLTLPDGSLHSVNAADADCYCADCNAVSYDMWVCHADVTDLLLAHGGNMLGTYSVASYRGKISNSATDNASTTLFLVFSDNSLRPRQVSLYDGIVTMFHSSADPSTGNRTISLSGVDIDSPPQGKLTYWVLEGDAGSGTGNKEEVSVNGNPGSAGPLVLSDSINPANNPMNGTINTTVPTQTNLVGVDIDQFDITAALTARDSSVDVNYSATTEKWWIAINVIGFDTYDPNFARTSTKTAALHQDLDGDGQVDVGDTVRYTIALRNSGNEAGTTNISDELPLEASSWSFVSTSAGTPASSGNTVRVNNITLQPGGEAFIIFDVVVANVVDESLMNNRFSWTAPPQGGGPGTIWAEAVSLRRDRDQDGWHDNDDNCPDDHNPTQADSNGDGVGDVCQACPDADFDGYADLACGGADCDDGDNTVYPNAPERCDGKDNDCDPRSADGSGEGWNGQLCDSADADFCAEGVYSCVGGVQLCSDNVIDNLELCDGQDNDCNAATPDGIDEDWYGDPCDGADLDLCIEGSLSCVGGQQVCSDDTGDNPERCDGTDNDCNPATVCAEVCDNGLDDDQNDLVDCFDPACVAHPSCVEQCGNGLDDDHDGLFDCDDIDCVGDPACEPEPLEDEELEEQLEVQPELDELETDSNEGRPDFVVNSSPADCTCALASSSPRGGALLLLLALVALLRRSRRS